MATPALFLQNIEVSFQHTCYLRTYSPHPKSKRRPIPPWPYDKAAPHHSLPPCPPIVTYPASPCSLETLSPKIRIFRAAIYSIESGKVFRPDEKNPGFERRIAAAICARFVQNVFLGNQEFPQKTAGKAPRPIPPNCCLPPKCQAIGGFEEFPGKIPCRAIHDTNTGHLW